jgi:hypothetical protein
MKLILKMLACIVLFLGAVGASSAIAQSEPSMNQIYTTAQSGKLDDALVMVQQVLVAHPNSAKAYFVQAELYSRQGKLDLARQSLLSAEQHAPGLPFAKPESVQALKAQLATKPDSATATTRVVPAQSAPPSRTWMLPLLLAGGVITAAFFLFRKRPPQVLAQQPQYATTNALTGAQVFGATGSPQPAYPQPGYPQGYAQPASSGLGGKIMGGVATGLAVGAGVMAAEAIGRNLMGGQSSTGSHTDPLAGDRNFDPIAPDANRDMGGNNFGITDTGWDDGASDAGGSDWDN